MVETILRGPREIACSQDEMPLGRRIDESSPMVDARLKDGSRVNAIIPPLAVDGPSLSIRRFRTGRLGADDLVDRESMTQPMLDFLRRPWPAG